MNGCRGPELGGPERPAHRMVVVAAIVCREVGQARSLPGRPRQFVGSPGSRLRETLREPTTSGRVQICNRAADDAALERPGCTTRGRTGRGDDGQRFEPYPRTAEKALGHRFKDRRSWCARSRTRRSPSSGWTLTRMEFLGDSVAGAGGLRADLPAVPTAASREMTKIKSTAVSRQTCA